MKIDNGEYVYPFFNAYFIQNMLSLSLYSLARGYLPHIELGNRKDDYTNWQTFFEQPFKTNTAQCVISNDVPRGYCNYWMDIAWDKKQLKRWCRVYHALVRYNAQTKRYMDDDYNAIIQHGQKILGVLCRGSDYLVIKPKGHPIQPTIDEMVKKVEEVFRNGQYDKIYLATEDERIEQHFMNTFPDTIIVNKRLYFAESFERLRRNNSSVDITDVKLNGTDANYKRGIQYLSSMEILSRCDGLVASNCGGTVLALLMNNMKYNYTYVFNLGFY